MTAQLHPEKAAAPAVAGPNVLERPPGPETPTGLRLLLELALKRLESQERTVDTLNTRAGAVFGFSTLLLTAAVPVVDDLGPGAARLWFGLLSAAAWTAMLLSCWRAFRVRPVAVGPDVRALFDQGLDGAPEPEAQREALGSALQGIELNDDTLRRKARALHWALLSVVALIAALAAGAAFPYLRDELWPWLGRTLGENTSPGWVGGTRP